MPCGNTIGPQLNGTLPELLTRFQRPMIGLLVEVEARDRRQGGFLLRIAPAAKCVLLANEHVPRLLLDGEAPELASERVRVLVRVLEPAHDAPDLVCRVGDHVLFAIRVALAACASEADPAPLREDLLAHRVLVSVFGVATVLKRTYRNAFR